MGQCHELKLNPFYNKNMKNEKFIMEFFNSVYLTTDMWYRFSTCFILVHAIYIFYKLGFCRAVSYETQGFTGTPGDYCEHSTFKKMLPIQGP